ncbi:MAG: CAP domain-containing protein [Candidatus Limnocylindrales bacterium]
MRPITRRFAPMALAAALLIGLVPAVAAAESADTSTAAVAAAEQGALTLTNKRRSEAGLVALKWDQRVADLAKQRAEYMAAADDMSHIQADGTDVFDMIDASGIKWFGAGEILAWNNAADLDYSVAFAVQGWMGSPPHKAIVRSSGYNYVGFGMAISPESGRRYWAGVYLKGPDRTSTWTRVAPIRKTNLDSTRARVTVDWSGGDTRLQVLTSGLRYYQVQARRDGGPWSTYDTTTSSVLTRTWLRGHVVNVRIRSRDKAGNWSGWTTVTLRT